jgi:hypothetical protein
MNIKNLIKDISKLMSNKKMTLGDFFGMLSKYAEGLQGDSLLSLQKALQDLNDNILYDNILEKKVAELLKGINIQNINVVRNRTRVATHVQYALNSTEASEAKKKLIAILNVLTENDIHPELVTKNSIIIDGNTEKDDIKRLLESNKINYEAIILTHNRATDVIYVKLSDEKDANKVREILKEAGFTLFDDLDSVVDDNLFVIDANKVRDYDANKVKNENSQNAQVDIVN